MPRWMVMVTLLLSASVVNAGVNLLGYWDFDEGSGLAVQDSSGNANHGTVEGATWIDGALGHAALSFEGTDVVDIGDRSNLEVAAFSVGMCVRSSAFQNLWAYFLSEGQGTGCGCPSYAFWTGGGRGIQFFTCDGSTLSQTSAIPRESVFDGQWHRVVASHDGAFNRIYLDGIQVGGPVAAVAPNYNLLFHSDFRIGHISNACAGAFVGDIDEVKVWDSALSDEEIGALGECSPIFEDNFESSDTSAWSMTVSPP